MANHETIQIEDKDNSAYFDFKTGDVITLPVTPMMTEEIVFDERGNTIGFNQVWADVSKNTPNE